MKKIAIIGAGFCGLSVAWNLLQSGENNLTIFDHSPLASNTSGIAAGLLHPFVGFHSRLNSDGLEGYAAAADLIDEVEKALGRPVAKRTGVLRIPINEEQLHYFQTAAALHPEHIKWMNSDENKSFIPGKSIPSGIFIRKAMTVFSSLYLDGLWKLCSNRGARWENGKIRALSELSSYDLVIVTAGAETTFLPELKDIPLSRTKGQLLYMQWPQDHPPLRHPMSSSFYCMMTADERDLIVGSTYEKQFASTEPDVEVAKELLLPRLPELLPFVMDAPIVSCHAGVRASTPNRAPLLKQMDERTWVLTGMGSKGLLYHALYAQRLCNKLLS